MRREEMKNAIRVSKQESSEFEGERFVGRNRFRCRVGLVNWGQWGRSMTRRQITLSFTCLWAYLELYLMDFNIVGFFFFQETCYRLGRARAMC